MRSSDVCDPTNTPTDPLDSADPAVRQRLWSASGVMETAAVSSRYVLAQRLGAGSYSVVYLGYDAKHNDAPVAIKILRQLYWSDPFIRERFLLEPRLTASVNHPNVVRMVAELEGANELNYFALEYVPGHTLGDVIRGSGPGSRQRAHYLDEVLSVIIQATSGLVAVHEQGIVHRDIKPGNILIGSEGAKISDFGVAWCPGKPHDVYPGIGTLSYLSPEQALGGRIDGRADIYAVGLTLYTALVGEPPFMGDDAPHCHVYYIPREPRLDNPAVPDDLNRLVMRCLQKEPADRYPNAAALCDALGEVRENLVH